MLRALMGRLRRFLDGLIGEAAPQPVAQPVPISRPTRPTRT